MTLKESRRMLKLGVAELVSRGVDVVSWKAGERQEG